MGCYVFVMHPCVYISPWPHSREWCIRDVLLALGHDVRNTLITKLTVLSLHVCCKLYCMESHIYIYTQLSSYAYSSPSNILFRQPNQPLFCECYRLYCTCCAWRPRSARIHSLCWFVSTVPDISDMYVCGSGILAKCERLTSECATYLGHLLT